MAARAAGSAFHHRRMVGTVELSPVGIGVAGGAVPVTVLHCPEVIDHATERPAELIGIRPARVAALAQGLGMGADHGKAGPMAVVETRCGDLREGGRQVAPRAVAGFKGPGNLAEPVEEPAVGVGMAAIALGWGPGESPPTSLDRSIVTIGAIDLEVAAIQGECGTPVLLRGECMGLELAAVVASDAPLGGKGALVELTAVGIPMTLAAIIWLPAGVTHVE